MAEQGKHPAVRSTQGTVKNEVEVVLAEAPDELRLRWHGDQPRRIAFYLGGHLVAEAPVAMLPGETLVIKTLPPSDFDRAMAVILTGDFRVIEDDGEAG